MIGVGNGKIDTLMMQSIISRFKKIMSFPWVNEVEELSDRIDYKEFITI